MHKFVFTVALGLGLMSCGKEVQVLEYQSLPKGIWAKDQALEFQFSEMDTLLPHHIFLHVRNDASYRYSNLFLIANMTTPEGEVLTDTLEYQMALPDGTWLGKGMGSIKENKLWYKENIVFGSSGVYTINVAQAMRKNGSVAGIEQLQGITDVGIEIGKTNE
ncbi:gliding motility lipoprotein GldH [Maribacter sp. 2307ULW6-5]|uniref:gliding motility lipoprotein GldH n=1 Tax=Maribacter sp. 2307ULW6-5 TaxID=3386275 RepID=UPI0039BD90E6